MLKITYLFHSGFIVETERHFMVFDYFKDSCKKSKYRDCGQLKREDIPEDKKVLIFVSHSHCDHFSKEIFTFEKPNVEYIFDAGVAAGNEAPNIHRFLPYESHYIGDVMIKTYGSTDEGLSFFIEVDGMKIFHAGDLNWWHWSGESEEERAYAKQFFEKEMSLIEEMAMDVAFFPVDPRLEEAYYYGGEYFIRRIHPKVFIPMHFQDGYEFTRKFKEHMGDCGTEIITIDSRGTVVFEKGGRKG